MGKKRVLTNDFLNKSVGVVIKSFGTARGLTNEQAAEKIGVSKQVYYKMIRGQKQITFVEVMRVIEAYETTPVIFFNRVTGVKIQNYMRLECSK